MNVRRALSNGAYKVARILAPQQPIYPTTYYLGLLDEYGDEPFFDPYYYRLPVEVPDLSCFVNDKRIEFKGNSAPWRMDYLGWFRSQDSITPFHTTALDLPSLLRVGDLLRFDPGHICLTAGNNYQDERARR